MLTAVFGLLFTLMIGVQTKLFVAKATTFNLCGIVIWTAVSNLIWCHLIRKVAFTDGVVLYYVIGTALGALFATLINQRLGGKL